MKVPEIEAPKSRQVAEIDSAGSLSIRKSIDQNHPKCPMEYPNLVNVRIQAAGATEQSHLLQSNLTGGGSK